MEHYKENAVDAVVPTGFQAASHWTPILQNLDVSRNKKYCSNFDPNLKLTNYGKATSDILSQPAVKGICGRRDFRTIVSYLNRILLGYLGFCICNVAFGGKGRCDVDGWQLYAFADCTRLLHTRTGHCLALDV